MKNIEYIGLLNTSIQHHGYKVHIAVDAGLYTNIFGSKFLTEHGIKITNERMGVANSLCGAKKLRQYHKPSGGVLLANFDMSKVTCERCLKIHDERNGIERPLIELMEQGAPIVNIDNARVYKKRDGIALLIVDRASKYCEVLMTGGGTDIYIVAGEASIKLKDGIEREKATCIKILGYDGWEIFLTDISRYTLRVCLMRP